MQPDDPEFIAAGTRLSVVANAVEKLATADAHYDMVVIDARANGIRIFRRGDDADHARVLSVYREIVPADVDLEICDSVLTAAERQTIVESIRGFKGRLKSRGFRVQGIRAGESGGPVVVSYLRSPVPLTFQLLIDLGVTRRWPDDTLSRPAVVLEMLDEAILRSW